MEGKLQYGIISVFCYSSYTVHVYMPCLVFTRKDLRIIFDLLIDLLYLFHDDFITISLAQHCFSVMSRASLSLLLSVHPSLEA